MQNTKRTEYSLPKGMKKPPKACRKCPRPTTTAENAVPGGAASCGRERPSGGPDPVPQPVGARPGGGRCPRSLSHCSESPVEGLGRHLGQTGETQTPPHTRHLSHRGRLGQGCVACPVPLIRILLKRKKFSLTSSRA